MSTEQAIVIVAAAAIALWPHVESLVKLAMKYVRGVAPGSPAATVGFEAAIRDLAGVRSRLNETGYLTDAEKKAIDTLTLALVAGSDK